MLRTHTRTLEGRDRGAGYLVPAVGSADTDPGDDAFGPWAKRGIRKSLAANRVLFQKGDPAHGLYLLLTGHAKLASTSTTDGKDLVLAILGPGDVFGEGALEESGTYKTTAITLTPCELLFLSRYDALASMRDNSGFVLKLVSAMAQRFLMATNLIEDLVFATLPTRLAKTLLVLGRTLGRPVAEGLRIDCHLTQEELASMVGASRESINKLLAAWKNLGLLSMTRRCLILNRPDELLLTAARPIAAPKGATAA